MEDIDERLSGYFRYQRWLPILPRRNAHITDASSPESTIANVLGSGTVLKTTTSS
jgi:hypothetical protein